MSMHSYQKITNMNKILQYNTYTITWAEDPLNDKNELLGFKRKPLFINDDGYFVCQLYENEYKKIWKQLYKNTDKVAEKFVSSDKSMQYVVVDGETIAEYNPQSGEIKGVKAGIYVIDENTDFTNKYDYPTPPSNELHFTKLILVINKTPMIKKLEVEFYKTDIYDEKYKRENLHIEIDDTGKPIQPWTYLQFVCTYDSGDVKIFNDSMDPIREYDKFTEIAKLIEIRQDGSENVINITYTKDFPYINKATPEKLAYRNLFYTALTRAKDLLVLVGNENSIRAMVDNDKKSRRYSALKYFIENQEKI